MINFLTNKNKIIFFIALLIFTVFILLKTYQTPIKDSCFHESFGELINVNNSNKQVSINCESGLEVSGISIYFPGNLHSVGSYKPSNIEIIAINGTEEIYKKDIKIKSNFFKLDLDEEVVINEFKIFSHSNNDVLFDKLLIYKKIKFTDTDNILKFL